jgi:hypothetical protein
MCRNQSTVKKRMLYLVCFLTVRVNVMYIIYIFLTVWWYQHIIIVFVFLFLSPRGWPHEWLKHVGDYYIINLHSYTEMYLLAFFNIYIYIYIYIHTHTHTHKHTHLINARNTKHTKPKKRKLQIWQSCAKIPSFCNCVSVKFALNWTVFRGSAEPTYKCPIWISK